MSHLNSSNVISSKDGLTELKHRKSVNDIIQEYKIIASKLSLLADQVPHGDDIVGLVDTSEIELLDRQAALLNEAITTPIKSLDDAKAVLTLWHYEVIRSQNVDSLTAADDLVNSVHLFLNGEI